MIQKNSLDTKSIEIFTTTYNEWAKNFSIMGKSYDQWANYFKVDITDTELIISLRKNLAENSKKQQEAEFIYGRLKLSSSKIGIEEFTKLKIDFFNKHEEQSKKNINEAEREAAKKNMDVTTAKMISDMLLESWETLLWSIKNKGKVIENLMIALEAEMKHGLR